MSETAILYTPLILIVVGNVLYNVIGKAVPSEVDPFASLIVTYLTSLIASAALFFLMLEPGITPGAAFGTLNWTSFALGLAIVLIDSSVIMTYRVGWDISIGTLIGNIGVSVLSVIAGIALWNEPLTFSLLVGVVLCLAGVTTISLSDAKAITHENECAPKKEKLGRRLGFFAPIGIMLAARFAYMLVQKAAPEEANPYASVMLAYASCLVCASGAMMVSRRRQGWRQAFSHVNWTAPAFGACLVLLDISTLWLFRAGWDLSIGTLLMYVFQAIALVAIGIAVYREHMTPKRGAGIGACMAGIILVMA